MAYALVIHGGAGTRPELDYTEQSKHMLELVHTGQKMLQSGRDAVSVVAEMVAEMESSGLYVAGKGTAPNMSGRFELDASIMDGRNGRAGAIAAAEGVMHPIRAARAIMEEGRHVLLAGQGAGDFAKKSGLEMVDDPNAYYTTHEQHGSGDKGGHGTVGAVALDQGGRLAAATSTGGTFGKMLGRVGDSPLIGAGTWADRQVAVSCTGVGEYFIRSAAAHDVSARMRYAGHGLRQAGDGVITEIGALGGRGGLIAVDANGTIAMPYNSDGMKRAAVSSTIAPFVRVFEPEPDLG